jgi:hypothetical protein
MRVSEIVSRLTEISTPIGGVSWRPPTPDVDVARRVLTFLEDRRVLYNPSEAEVAEHCISSVVQIREFLTEVLAEQGIGNELAEPLRAMRAACRRFLDWFGPLETPGDFYLPYGNGLQDWRLNQGLGELRAVFGLHIAKIAVKYGLDVEWPLSDAIHVALPAAQDDEEG